MPKSYTHFTFSDRLVIEQSLEQHLSFRAIALKLNKHPTTIKREVYERSTESLKGATHKVTNRCVNRHECTKRQLCIDTPNCTRKCSLCKHCNEKCDAFKEEFCSQLNTPPYVCNGCTKRHLCTLRKMLYIAKQAELDYRTTLVKTREGANITEAELLHLDTLVSPRLLKGQSTRSICQTSKDALTVCDKTIYRYINGGLLTVRNGDLPRKCMVKPRKSAQPKEHKVDTKCRLGRSYAVYQAHIEERPQLNIVQMDTVIGRIGGKVLLTLHSVNAHFTIARLIPDKSSASVIAAFNKLYEELGAETFKTLFPVILTDNGTEFSNPTALETSPTGEQRTRIYYCDPYHSNQKSQIERNHEHIRKVLPKKTSFDNLTEADIDLINSHVNSYVREVINFKTPIDLFDLIYSPQIRKKLRVRLIATEEINLTPKLLNR